MAKKKLFRNTSRQSAHSFDHCLPLGALYHHMENKNTKLSFENVKKEKYQNDN